MAKEEPEDSQHTSDKYLRRQKVSYLDLIITHYIHVSNYHWVRLSTIRTNIVCKYNALVISRHNQYSQTD